MAGDDLDACDFPIILGVAISHHIWGCSFISGQLRTYSYKGIVPYSTPASGNYLFFLVIPMFGTNCNPKYGLYMTHLDTDPWI